MNTKTDSVAVVDKDGKMSNVALHEAMTQGVDDTAIRMKSKSQLKKLGVDQGVLDRLLK